MTSQHDRSGWRARFAALFTTADSPVSASDADAHHRAADASVAGDDADFASADDDDSAPVSAPDTRADKTIPSPRAPHKTPRDITVEGKVYRVPQGVIPTEFGWRARYREFGYALRFWRFEGQGLTREELLVQAAAWMAMEHPREFVVSRTATAAGSGRECFTPRFILTLKNSPGGPSPAWMRQKLSGLWFITQDRIDEGLEKLHRALDHYEVRRRTMCHSDACDFREAEVDRAFVLHRAAKPMSLKLHDLLAWTGQAQGVTFDPPECVQAGRTQLYWPELEQFVQERCPTIRADL